MLKKELKNKKIFAGSLIADKEKKNIKKERNGIPTHQ